MKHLAAKQKMPTFVDFLYTQNGVREEIVMLASVNLSILN